MGRPKGSKNKPKVTAPDSNPTELKIPSASNLKKEPIEAPQQHIVFQFADYVLERMDGIETAWYRRFASKNDKPIKYVVVKTIIDFFRIQDQSLDLTALAKPKND